MNNHKIVRNFAANEQRYDSYLSEDHRAMLEPNQNHYKIAVSIIALTIAVLGLIKALISFF
jgi:hypothetical protein